MTFRIEEKIFINKSQIIDFKKWLKSNGATIIYPSRVIQSLYFENNKSQMYLDSEEGCLPRKKIRVRNYPNQKNQKYNLETKISSIEGRYKTSSKLNISEYSRLKTNGHFDYQYGLCLPKLIVKYVREYYEVNQERVTLDYNISYSYSNDLIKLYKRDEMVSVEIKANINNSLSDLKIKFPFQRIRFSKYCRGYKSLYLN